MEKFKKVLDLWSNYIKTVKELIDNSRQTIRSLIDSYFKEVDYDTVLKMKDFELNIIYKAVGILTRKWAVNVLWELEVHDGLIFNELMRHLDGISSRSLSNILKKLEKYHLISRSVQETRPPSVLYELTDKGKGLVELSFLIVIHLVY